MIVGRGAQTSSRTSKSAIAFRLRDSHGTSSAYSKAAATSTSRALSPTIDVDVRVQAAQAANSVTVLLASEGRFDEFKTALTTNPTLSVSVERESDYYQRQSENANDVLRPRDDVRRRSHGAQARCSRR